MYERILRRMRHSIRALEYVMTVHAEEEMSDGDLTILDVEHVVLSGRILARQRDRDAGGWKYVVRGRAPTGSPVEVVGRLSMSGRLIIVTVYRA